MITEALKETTDIENRVLDATVTAWSNFLKLDPGGDDMNDFRKCINDCQRIIASRREQRANPKTWNIPD